MIRLPNSLAAWPSVAFAEVLRNEVEQLDSAALPLQAGLSNGSYVAGERFSAMFIGAVETGNCIEAKVGVFYAGIVAGCNCADDPTPVEPLAEYCEILISIDRATAEASCTLV
jgi:hypothetical protein